MKIIGGPAALSGDLWRVTLLGVLVCTTMGPRSYDVGSFPPACTGGRGLGVEGETGHGDKKRVLQEWG